MQLRRLVGFALFVGSYFPLALILLVQDIDPIAIKAGYCPGPLAWVQGACRLPLLHPALSAGAATLSVCCVILTLIILRGIPMGHRIRVLEAKHVPADLINYVIPYVVSFMGIDFGAPTKLAGFLVFFVWLYWITYRSGQVIMNPLLVVFGWQLFEIRYSFLQSSDVRSGRALARFELEPGHLYRKSDLQDVLIVRNGDQDSNG